MGASAAVGLTLAGGGLQAYGQYQSGRANERLMDYNARLAEQQAEDALARGREAERRMRTDVRRTIGSQRARLAASGVDISAEGSAVDLFADTARLGELDALTIRNNAAREAWGYRTQAVDYRARGDLARREGTYRAVGTLLTTGARAYGMRAPSATARTGRARYGADYDAYNEAGY